MSSSESNVYNKNISDSDSEASDTFIDTKHINTVFKDVIANMSREELHRYETFRRVGLKRNMIKRLCFEVIGQSCNPKFIITVCGFAKVFVGELVTEAKKVQKEWGDTGPLLVTHVHEAYRQLYKTMPNMVVSPSSLL